MLVLLLTLGLASADDLGVATPVVDEGHLQGWFEALARAEAGEGVARALHWGDSTIAADGISRTVRARLGSRFGDGGPGFVTAAFTPTYHIRSDVEVDRSGPWEVRTILRGGGGERYGLGGVVGIARAGTQVRLHARDAEGAPRPMTRGEVWVQAGTDYGRLMLRLDDADPVAVELSADATEDRVIPLTSADPFTTLELSVADGSAPLYGVVLEAADAGSTWEQLGVVGVSSRSLTRHAGAALAEQVALRKADLLVLQLGGNEVGYPTVRRGDGAEYAPVFAEALRTVRAGAPDTACLVLAPLDQGELDDESGTLRQKPGVPNLVAQQAAVASDAGCAFWNTVDAMGGHGSAITWGRTKGIGGGDFIHVRPKGQAILGDLLSDALLAAYDRWKAAQG